MGTKWSVNKNPLEVGSIYPTNNYGDLEIISDEGSRSVTVVFIDTKTIVSGVNRSSIKRGKVKDPSLKVVVKRDNLKAGSNSENSYLRFLDKSFILGEKFWYKCILCNKEYSLSRKYRDCEIPSSCGCLNSIKPRGEDFTGKVVEGVLFIGYHKNSKWLVEYSCGCKTFVSIKEALKYDGVCKKCFTPPPQRRDYSRVRARTSWRNMRERCLNPDNNRYKYYGEKGVSICPRWETSFEHFLEDMGACPEGLTLERKDVSKGYSKDNCIWADTVTQANNKTNNILISNGSEVMSLRYWCRQEGVNYKNAHYQLRKRKESVENILGRQYFLVDSKLQIGRQNKEQHMQETKTLIQHIIEDHGVFIPKDHSSFTSDEELMEASPDILSDILYALDMYSEDFDEESYLEEDGFGL